MEALLEFGRGPLFHTCFALMVLGLARIFILTVIGMAEAWRRSDDKIIPWGDLTRRTVSWLVPIASLWRKRPVYSVVSFLFHVGLLLVPLFLSAHVLLWQNAVGFAWPALPQTAADYLTLLAIAGGVALFIGRVFSRAARSISRRQEFLWPLLLVVPFLSGYFCSNGRISASTYQQLMLVHVYSGNLIMVLIPFTKIAHCVLIPLAQYVTGIAWKFPAGGGERATATLGYPDRPVWVEKPRVSTHRVPSNVEEAAS